ncbi:MAG: rod shape-determining protein [Clostridia bacterium]|nr:rod shape-determining protein [Clostridia bacterium]
MRGICIDLGSGNTSISALVKGNVFTQPSVVTIDTDDNIITDAGSISKEAIGKTPEHLMTVKPLNGGVIADYSAAEGMVKLLVKKAFNRSVFTGVNALVTTPSDATQMEKRAAAETVKNLGVSTVNTIECSMAAAIGAGVNVMTPTGSMVVDIGAGVADASVIALGTIATGSCVKVAGDAMDAAIVAYVKRKYSILIGENTAERMKIELGCAVPKEKNELKKYKGRDIASGLPKEFAVYSEEIRVVISDILKKIIDSVVITLEKTPPELLSDVIESGIILTGGCSQIYGIEELFTKKTGFKTTVAQDPAMCTLRGAEKVFLDKKLRKLVKKN